MEELDSSRAQMANIWHNLLYSFENPFRTPFETPNNTSGIVIMVHPDEIKCHLEEQAHETQRTLYAIYVMERENQNVDTNNQAHYEGHKGACP